jgi:hypothetical protein
MGKSSISMGHLYHGYVSHTQRVNKSSMGYLKPAGSDLDDFRWNISIHF